MNCQVQHKYERTNVQIQDFISEEHRIIHLKAFLLDIWNSRIQAEQICSSTNTLTTWIENLIENHPNEAGHWIDSTSLVPDQNPPTVQVQIPVDNVDENELELLVQQVEIKIKAHLQTKIKILYLNLVSLV